MRRGYDAVVVGSGFGGGVAACRLAEAGWKVCVLERGRRFQPADFPDHTNQAARLVWHHSANPGGMYDLRLFSDGVVIVAAGVGGGSLVYANVQLPAQPDVFEQHWPAAIDRTALDPYYDRVREALGAQPTPDRQLPKLRAFRAMGAKVDRRAERVPVAVHFGEDRANPFGGAPQQGCTQLGRCLIGCPRHAKNTVDLTYLARGERHGAEVFPLHEVDRIDPPSGRGHRWTVGFRNLDGGRRGEVRAGVVVLAAGTLGSTRLLLSNRRRLPRLSRTLGSRFSGNGNALGTIYDVQARGARDVNPEFGPTITSRIDYWADRRFVLEDGGVPPGFLSLMEVLRGASKITGWRRALLRVKDVAARAGLSDRSVTPRHVGLNGARPGVDDTLAFLFIGEDTAGGSLRLSPLLGRLDVRYPREQNRTLFARMDATLTELAEAIGGRAVFSLDNGPLGRLVIGHPLGGCPMADDPRDGVVDEHGGVYGYEDGLVVLDGSIVPTALGANPSMTIAALAERGVEQLISHGRN